MSSASNAVSGTINTNAAQPLARQILANSETNLTPTQLVALLRVLQESPPHDKENQVQPQKPERQYKLTNQQLRQQKFVQQQMRQSQAVEEPKQNTNKRQYRYELVRPTRSVINVLIAVFLTVFLTSAGFSGWYYWWTTHAAFEYTLTPVVVLEGQDIDAGSFLASGEDMGRVSAAFKNTPQKPSAGWFDVPLTLTMGWRTVEANSYLYVLSTVKSIKHEYAEYGPELRPADFILNADIASGVPFDVRFVNEPELLEEYPVGEHTLYLTLNGAPFEVLLIVEDTTPPVAIPLSKSVRIGENVGPEDFVTGISDASDDLPISISFYREEPDVFNSRDQIIEIKLEDFYGNYAVINAGLSIQLNRYPPVINGTDTIITMVGDPILYMQGVTAYDDFGRDFTEMVTVDNSEVNQFAAGIYTVRYLVEDFSGLTFVVEETVHVLDIDIDYVNEQVDEELAKILREDMTQLNQVHAIYTWVKRNLTYAQNRDRPETAYEGAYRALRDRRGNCYVFYSISAVMLERAGIPNMLIERIEGTPTRHRWNLVNPDELGWHHYDSYPVRASHGVQMSFFTDSQATLLTQRLSNLAIRPAQNYYTYDPSLYPEIVQ